MTATAGTSDAAAVGTATFSTAAVGATDTISRVRAFSAGVSTAECCVGAAGLTGRATVFLVLVVVGAAALGAVGRAADLEDGSGAFAARAWTSGSTTWVGVGSRSSVCGSATVSTGSLTAGCAAGGAFGSAGATGFAAGVGFAPVTADVVLSSLWAAPSPAASALRPIGRSESPDFDDLFQFFSVRWLRGFCSDFLAGFSEVFAESDPVFSVFVPPPVGPADAGEPPDEPALSGPSVPAEATPVAAATPTPTTTANAPTRPETAPARMPDTPIQLALRHR